MAEGGAKGIASAGPSPVSPFRQAVALLGVPVEIGASRRGTSTGPGALRAAGLVSVLEAAGAAVEDHGDLSRRDLRPIDAPAPPNAKHYREIQAWARVLSSRAYAMSGAGVIPIFLGGDHSLSMGSINGVARRCREAGQPLFVLWLDAHADYNTPATTPSGNMHGMSAAFLCGEAGLDDLLHDEPRAPIQRDHLELFGTRSIDDLEQQLLRERRIRVIGMREIAEIGADVLVRRLTERVKGCNGALHVSFDVDFLDPALAPGVGTTVMGGATEHEAQMVMDALRESGVVRSVDVVELNPALDPLHVTARLAVDLIGRLFGHGSGQRARPDA